MRQPCPSEIERVRSLAATATPTAVALADDPDTRFSASGAVDRVGRVVLLIGTDHPLHGALREVSRGSTGPRAGVDLCAIRHVGRTPTVRARLWCEGRVSEVPAHERRQAALAIWERHPDEGLLAAVDNDPTPDGPLLACIEPDVVVYDTYDDAGVIDGAAFRAARPDPLTLPAERILARVNDRHRDELSASLRDVPDVPQGRAWLWELDGFGATLWVSPYASDRPVLVRLPWNVRATAPCQLEGALRELLGRRGALR
ncbi:DUF2470 domain-containing protein [Marinactinospora thermotolerans]|uniref:DUF2470 domain-containing protein n=1 Tax=Marinactinospora thermotolerans DSM 45154 TaxID=1122192 RepID=A0A1T4MD44_9ACTN|nr:hypothetical protein [Marinactinospora thermotolerans]SJZ64873.1 hypothetical protein SAMN02745673_01058 [Marinactinospora thermotolerans DSM 45154]